MFFFRWSKCSRSDNIALREDPALWLIYSPNLVKKNGGMGRSHRLSNVNGRTSFGLQAKNHQQTDFQDFLSSRSSTASVNSVKITGGHLIFWNSLGTLSTLKVPWHVFLSVLFLSGFYSSIDFNGLQLPSLVSESLEFIYTEHRLLDHYSHFFPSDSLNHYFFTLVYYFNWAKFRNV